jgi:hypothetical protein
MLDLSSWLRIGTGEIWFVDWIEVDQDTDRWRALVNAEMKFQFPQNVGNILTSW